MDNRTWIERREINKTGFFENPRHIYDDNIDLSLASLRTYADGKNIAITYSGGKDSSATLALCLWAIQEGQFHPANLIVLYADTGLELPPLHLSAMQNLDVVRSMGYEAVVVQADIENRLYVKMLGYGYPFPSNRRRWCTRLLKKEPMDRALAELDGEWISITGVRLGESGARDDRITTSCNTGDGECGQGWYQQARNALAPIVHWRACHVFRYLFVDQQRNPLFDTVKHVEQVYRYDEFVPNGIRTGCIRCQIVHEDMSFNALVKYDPFWSFLEPLRELDELHDWLSKPAQRHRKVEPTGKADGSLRNRRGAPLGPLTMDARRIGLDWLKRIQDKTNQDAPAGYEITLVSVEEQSAIRQMWSDGTYPQGWTGDEPIGDYPYRRINVKDGEILSYQPLLPDIAWDSF